MRTKQQITIAILSLLDRYAEPGSEVIPSAYFYDLGIDSLDRVEIFIEVERLFGINIHDNYDPQQIETVSQLINTVYVCLSEEQT